MSSRSSAKQTLPHSEDVVWLRLFVLKEWAYTEVPDGLLPEMLQDRSL